MITFVNVIAISLLLEGILFVEISAANDSFSFFFKTLGHEDLFPSNSTNKKKSGSQLFNNFLNQQSALAPQTNSQPQFFFTLPTFSPQHSGFTLPTIPPAKSEFPPDWTSIEEQMEDEDERKVCELSITTVKGKKVCKGKVLFVDDFKNKANTDIKWSHEVFIPSYSSEIQDTIFNYFDKNGTHMEDGKMVFTPVIMDDQFVRRGHLKLDGCTGVTVEECEKTAQFQWILPPVASARVTTKNFFSFKYGTIEIKAKFPKGDWLVPELWLEPKNKQYGEGLASGRIVLAMARGNRNLNSGGMELDYRVLESSLLMASNGKIKSRTLRVKTDEPWQAHHNSYQFTWRPDGYSLSVNGALIGQLVQNNFNGTLSSMVGFTHDEQRRWFSGSAMAPFDQEFYISLGLSVGGRDFPDNSVSGDYNKPWKSRTVKEMLDFYKAKDTWSKSWEDEVRKTLKISHVKVTAL